MRTHREWALAQCWAQRQQPKELFAVENLVGIQLESHVRRDIPGAVVTIRLDNGERGCSIPGIYLDEFALHAKLSDICIWPAAVARFASDSALMALQEAVYDWIEFALVGGGPARTASHIFIPERAELLGDAQKLGLFAAGPLAQTVTALQIAQYAGRFAPGAYLAVGEQFLNAGALLAYHVNAAAFPELTSAERLVAERWFDMRLDEALPTAHSATLVLGSALARTIAPHELARVIDTDAFEEACEVPCPPAQLSDEIARFGERQADNTAFFIKASDRTPLNPPQLCAPAIGGSSGSIVLMLRRDIYENPGADVDEALCLAECLRGEGFSVELCTDFQPEILARAAIVHIFGMWDPEPLDGAVQFAKERGIPCVITPLFEDAAVIGRWGAKASRTLIGSFDDENDLERALQRLATQRVEVDGISAQGRVDDGLDARRRELLRRADIVTVTGPAERDAVQRFSGRRRRIIEVQPLVTCYQSFEPIAHLVPDGTFVLIDASAEGRYNLGMAARVLATLDVPAVLLTAPVDRRLLRYVQSVSRPTVAVLTGVTHGQREFLYERAAVFVDIAWYGDGVHRLMHAAAHGQEIVVGHTRFVPPALEAEVVRVDPWSEQAIGAGIAEAWQRALNDKATRDYTALSKALNPANNLRSYVQVYAQAGEHLEQVTSKT